MKGNFTTLVVTSIGVALPVMLRCSMTCDISTNILSCNESNGGTQGPTKEEKTMKTSKEKFSDRLGKALIAFWVIIGGMNGFSFSSRGFKATANFSQEPQPLLLYGIVACVVTFILWMTYDTSTYNSELPMSESFIYVTTSIGGISVILLGMAAFFAVMSH